MEYEILKAKYEKAFHRVKYDGSGYEMVKRAEKEREREKELETQKTQQIKNLKNYLQNTKIEWL